jgi:hypothetical protein
MEPLPFNGELSVVLAAEEGDEKDVTLQCFLQN